ncbi:hypothetical protein [Streptomyces phaeochromogenes]|uniref:hypothetical protein n=1 Tax=Streptomyces phaeochromogenes TaxID=1923 RepID=UPI002DDAA93D|nr:hypothetical protein [Streptomyces phaeochromogenes]WRZ34717.1 hypothetical protein OG931_46775 [Streptomyces phaeochromogenes]
MPNPSLSSARLADDIWRELNRLTQLLDLSPPHETAQILGRVLDYDAGVLGRVTELVAAASRYAQNHAQGGNLPPETWLALARAANELDNINDDLNTHTGTFKHLSTTASPVARPSGSAMVVRRRR